MNQYGYEMINYSTLLSVCNVQQIIFLYHPIKMAGFHLYFRRPGLSQSQLDSVRYKVNSMVTEESLQDVEAELCFYVQTESNGG